MSSDSKEKLAPEQNEPVQPVSESLDQAAKGTNAEESSDNEQSIEVHSANSWETVNLGDKGRNEKFLRLMGASKKEHHGRFVIGDHEPSHVRKTKDTEHLTEELEEQFEQSMEHRLVGGRKGHIGLGFHPEGEETSEGPRLVGGEEKGDCEEETGDCEEDDSKVEDLNKTDEEKCREKDQRRRESLVRKRESSPESSDEVKKMKFVKSG